MNLFAHFIGFISNVTFYERIVFILFDAYLRDTLLQGQIFSIFIITVAAAEVGIGLAIVLMVFRNRQTANLNDFDLLKW